MTRYLAGCLALAALSLVPVRSSADPTFSDAPAVFDTVDAVEVNGVFIIVTGIVSGDSVSREIAYNIYDPLGSGSTAAASRCDRLALLAIAKPGKYQFAITTAIGGSGRLACKLIVRTP